MSYKGTETFTSDLEDCLGNKDLTKIEVTCCGYSDSVSIGGVEMSDSTAQEIFDHLKSWGIVE